jgi:hypothetical protein
MAKALVSIVNTDIDAGNVRLIYSVTLLGPPHVQYGSDFIINPAISLEKNLIALKDKIANYGVEKGHKMSTGDVIIFGAPVADSVSMKDETNGITSDTTAVVKEAVVVEQPTLITRMMDSLRSMWS